MRDPLDSLAIIEEEILKMLQLSEEQRQKQYGTEGWKLLVKHYIDRQTEEV